MKPVLIAGAGPVGLTTALGLGFYGLPFQLFEEDDSLSSDTKAGTILTRTIEAFRRYGIADEVLAKALRVDEIGDVERATNIARPSVRADLLADETRYPFVINMPQHHLEPILHRGLNERHPGCVHLRHKLVSFENRDDGVTATFETPDGLREVEGSYLLACDGGRSTIRSQLGIAGRRRIAERADAAGRREGRSRCAEPARLSLSRLFRRSDRMDDPGSPAALLALPVSACRRPAGTDARAIPRENPALHRPGTGHGDHQHHRLSHPSPHRDRVAARARLSDGRRRASDHADVGARTQYRHSRRHQPALAARPGWRAASPIRPCSTAMRASSVRSRRWVRARWRKPRANTCSARTTRCGRCPAARSPMR